jgi:protein BCP1
VPFLLPILCQDNRCIKEIKQYLLGVCKEEDTNVKLRQVLEEEARDGGLLVCQRFANFPYQLVLKIYEALFDEISWATEDEVPHSLLPSLYLCLALKLGDKEKNYIIL